MKRRSVLALPLMGGIAPLLSRAQGTFPDRPIRLVVPFSTGTALDLAARMMAEGVSEEIGGSIVVDNRLGASGVIGTDAVAKAVADGYTLLFTAPAHYINQFAFASLPYDAVKDFRPVTKISNAHLVMVVGKSSPFSNVKQVIEYAKANPDKLRYSSSGQGGTIHLAFSLFNSMAGTRIEHVPYKSGAQALTDVIAGHVDITFTAVASALPHGKQGTLKLLGVSGLQRSRAMPDVPTISESTLPGFELTSWGGTLAPHGTPDAIVEKLNAAMVKVGQRPEFQSKLVAMGVEPDVLNTAAFARQIDVEVPKWRQLTDMTGVAKTMKQ
ncbi:MULTISPECIES: tripartite tricarboxylate transporter substrate binding protein [Comamonadaceae]|uniref:Bug family tripartite tricarboxylate transporter substrate binding protein n=1 Tax=Comamonadaceae TaxID=80864 RepID=UPI0010F6D419|nr:MULTISPECIES: tripartite tricarboxylate transporter substrate binding protein [Comamonadaceae]